MRFKAFERVFHKHQPSLSCEREVDRFTVSSSNGNGALDYPVGLLTADEVLFAGGRYDTSNSSYYLYAGNDWWIGTPLSYSNTPVGFYVESNGMLDVYGYGVNQRKGGRPSISLKNNVIITEGDGTLDNPYILS